MFMFLSLSTTSTQRTGSSLRPSSWLSSVGTPSRSSHCHAIRKKNRVFRFFGLLHRCSADARDSPQRCERERVHRGSRAFLPVHGEREHTRTGESRESDIGVFPATTRQDTRLLIIGFVLLFSTSNFVADPLHEKPQLSRQPNEGVVVGL